MEKKIFNLLAKLIYLNAKKRGYEEEDFTENVIEMDWLIYNIKKKKAKIKKVLDIGCGEGIKTICLQNKFKDIKFFGIDKDKKKIDSAKEFLKYSKIKPKFKLENINKLSFKQSSFDCIISTRFFHFMKNKEKNVAFKEISKALKPKGFLFMIEFSSKKPFLNNISDRFWSRFKRKRYFIRLKYLLRLAKNNNFGLLKKEILKHYNFNLPLFKLIFQKEKL